MEIIHRLAFNARKNELQTKTLDEMRIKFAFHVLPSPASLEAPAGLVTLDIAESDPRWTLVKELSRQWNCIDQVYSTFTRTDLEQAEYLAIVPRWHQGYPMPDNNGGYLDKTYRGHLGCAICGVGRLQVEPFRMRSEPKWGRKNMLQLNWIFDEFFVTPVVFTNVFLPFGIQCREVLNYKSGKPLETVVQLCVSQVASDSRRHSEYDAICEECGRGKFFPHVRGFFPTFCPTDGSPIFKTDEYFGSDGSAWQAIIITKKLYRAMEDSGVSGVGFYPMESST
ncbi:MAG: hypothetical protein NTU79_17115 [Planctomycetota bacterium]|nr:hypothetical protein [Planctomycetota bacterium]